MDFKPLRGQPFGILLFTASLVQVLHESKDEFIAIELSGRLKPALVFPRAEMAADTDEILTDNGIRSQGPPDTMAIWNAKSAQQ
jgi:hypothetical protein